MKEPVAGPEAGKSGVVEIERAEHAAGGGVVDDGAVLPVSPRITVWPEPGTVSEIRFVLVGQFPPAVGVPLPSQVCAPAVTASRIIDDRMGRGLRVGFTSKDQVIMLSGFWIRHERGVGLPVGEPDAMRVFPVSVAKGQ